MEAIRYIAVASVCISAFYAFYRLFLKKGTRFTHLRYYLLGSIFLSLIIPLNSFRIDTGLTLNTRQADNALIVYGTGPQIATTEHLAFDSNKNIPMQVDRPGWYVLGGLLTLFYFIVAGIILLRTALHATSIFVLIIAEKKIKHADGILVYNQKFTHTFSFFRWIFIPSTNAADADLPQILAHEKTHINQYHSFDLLLMELLTAFMWFNPLVWMMKKSMMLVHEYLADEGVIKSGIDPLSYKALLINQVAEEKIICLSSGFNSVKFPGRQSQIKKRMIMITTNKMNSRTKHGLLTLLPTAVLLVVALSIFNGIAAENKQAEPSDQVEFISALGELLSGEFPANEPGDTIKIKHADLSVEAVSSERPDDTIKMIIEINHTKYDTAHTRDINAEKIITDELDRTIMHNVMVVEHDKAMVKHSEMTDDQKKVINKQKEMVIIQHSHDSAISKQHKMVLDTGTYTVYTHWNGNMNEDNHDGYKKIKVKGNAKKRLIIIDGKEHTDDDAIESLDPYKIKHIEVFTGESIKTYSDKDYQVVIVITTKEGSKESK